MENLNFGITRFRWIPLLSGIIAIGLGIWCFCSPVTSIPVMAYMFAAIICLAGVFNLTFAAVNRRHFPNWGWSLALGILDLLAGIWMLCLPEEELAITFVIVLGIWLVCIAINAICESFVISNNSVLWTIFAIVMLIVTIYFAALVLSSPLSMALAGWVYLGISLISFGIFRIAMYGRLQHLHQRTNGML